MLLRADSDLLPDELSSHCSPPRSWNSCCAESMCSIDNLIWHISVAHLHTTLKTYLHTCTHTHTHTCKHTHTHTHTHTHMHTHTHKHAHTRSCSLTHFLCHLARWLTCKLWSKRPCAQMASPSKRPSCAGCGRKFTRWMLWRRRSSCSLWLGVTECL